MTLFDTPTRPSQVAVVAVGIPFATQLVVGKGIEHGEQVAKPAGAIAVAPDALRTL